MIRRLLICTDGSRLAMKGVRKGVQLAKAIGGTITGVYVIPPPPSAYGETASHYAAGFTPAAFRKYTWNAARKGLGQLAQAGRAAHVRCGTRIVTDLQPWRGILRAARCSRARRSRSS